MIMEADKSQDLQSAGPRKHHWFSLIQGLEETSVPTHVLR